MLYFVETKGWHWLVIIYHLKEFIQYFFFNFVMFILGAGKSSFRVTVRQLESMIRLAEAMAKMECSDEVKVKHVQEAYRYAINTNIVVLRELETKE